MTKSVQWHKPRVSIVIPVYNGANYLREAIACALSQTYPNIEIIVVDDGSQDDGATQQIAQAFGNRIRLITKSNGGVASALNAAIDQMTGDFFSWLSHDDLYLPDKIAAEVDALLATGNDETIVFCDYANFTGAREIVGHSRFLNRFTKEQMETPLFAVFHRAIHGCSMLIHRNHFERVGGFNEGLLTTQDYEMWARLIRGQQLCFLPEELVLSRIHAQQGSRTMQARILFESEELWISLLEQLTREEIASLAPCASAFYGGLAIEFAKETPYGLTVDWLKDRHDQSMAACTEMLTEQVQVRCEGGRAVLTLAGKASEAALDLDALPAWCGAHQASGAVVHLHALEELRAVQALTNCGITTRVALEEKFGRSLKGSSLTERMRALLILARADAVDCADEAVSAQVQLFGGHCGAKESSGAQDMSAMQRVYRSMCYEAVDCAVGLDEARMQQKEMDRRIDELLTSRSWKITAPLRRLMGQRNK